MLVVACRGSAFAGRSLAQLAELGAQERAPREVERLSRLAARPAPAFHPPLASSRTTEIDNLHRKRRLLADALMWLTPLRREGRPQRLVAPHDFEKAPHERIHMERPLHAHRYRDVVGGAALHELVEDPEPLLGERQPELASSIRPRDGGKGGAFALDRLDAPGQVRYTR